MTLRRTLQSVGLGVAMYFLSGCSVLNPSVEFGQKKVPNFPEKSEKAREALRDAVWESLRLVNLGVGMAVAAGRPEEEVRPLSDASLLVGSVSRSVGSPRSVPDPDKTDPQKLAERLIEYDADFDAALKKFEKKLEPLAGKDVEGTGWIQTNQWTVIFAAAIGLFLFSFVYKVLNAVMNIANPAVGGVMGIGGGIAKFGAGKLQSAFVQVLKGGERFKDRVQKELAGSQFDKVTAEAILRLFREEHERAQDEGVQEAIRSLTRK